MYYFLKYAMSGGPGAGAAEASALRVPAPAAGSPHNLHVIATIITCNAQY